MKQFFYSIFATIALVVVGCSDYDDSDLVNRVGSLENRVSALEALCKEMNSNISSLQGLVTALQQNDYITDVTPISEGGTTIGYKISFAKGDPIEIYHGQDGQDGQDGAPGQDGKDASDLVPTIGVKLDNDGRYYWTLDGEWLLDDKGNKVPATGQDGQDGQNGQNGTPGTPGQDGQNGSDGKDGITPQFKIEEDYWYISYDNGLTWAKLGKATGEDGKDGISGGDSIFRSVTQDELYVYFELTDGTVLKLSKGAPLTITFEEGDLVVLSPHSTHRINYTVNSSIEPVKVAVTYSPDIRAKVITNDATALTGAIEVVTGDQIDEYSQVIVFVSNGEKIIMQTIAFEQSGLEIYDNATHTINAEGGEITLEFMTNMACEVEIPENVSWITKVPATRALELHTATLKVEANSGASRSCEVWVYAKENPNLAVCYTIRQEAAAAQPNQILYTTNDGQMISIDNEEFAATILTHTYADGQGIITFDSNLSKISEWAFSEAENLTTMVLPTGIKSIDYAAFSFCHSLTHVELPSDLEAIGDYLFYECMSMEELHIPHTVKSFGEFSFYQCSGTVTVSCNLEDVIADDGIYTNELPFYSSFFTTLIFDDQVTSIGDFSCMATESIQRLEIGKNVQRIGQQAFSGCNALVEIICHAVTPPALGNWAFNDYATIRVPDDSVMTYKNDPMWGQYNIMGINEEVYTSTDYSKDGLVTVLQRATEGNGVDVVIMGDAYSDRQIAAGYYEEDMTMAIDHLFSEEPYKSFRHLFNVSMVTAVSAHEGYNSGDTVFSGYFGGGTNVGGDDQTVFNYALQAIDADRMDEALIIVIMNRRYYAGTCWMYYPESGDYGNGISISYFPYENKEQLRSIILHEAGGHGFSKLADEYAYEEMGAISESIIEESRYLEEFGWYRNIDFTSDLSTIKWSRFLSDNRYANEGLGAFEGGMTYWSGVWRPTENSNMRYNEGGFNAPSREAIYNRIHKLAYGENWQFDYEEFVAWDAINRRSATSATTAGSYVYDFTPLHEPVIVRKSWREVVK